jgi:hypothetical protein
MEPQRPLATVRLPAKGHPAICAVLHEAAAQEAELGDLAAGPEGGSEAQQTRLAVATGDGLLYSYRLELPDPDDEHGGILRSFLEGEWNVGPAK